MFQVYNTQPYKRYFTRCEIYKETSITQHSQEKEKRVKIA